MGYNAEQYANKLNDGVCYKFNEINDQIKYIRAKYDVLYSEYCELTDDRSLFKKLLGKKDTPNWKHKREIEDKLNELTKQLKGLADDENHESKKLIDNIHAALILDDFLITSHSVNNDKHYEIWTREV
jgi:seryl-tRNA synthetase